MREQSEGAKDRGLNSTCACGGWAVGRKATLEELVSELRPKKRPGSKQDADLTWGHWGQKDREREDNTV